MDENLNIYKLSRNWFNWCFENPEKITPLHTALYFFAIEHCNRLGWKEKFGLPTEMTKEAIGIKSWHTYIKAFNDLVNWGFFILIEKSKNQYSSNIIALSKNIKALDKALDKATTKHVSKQVQSTNQSNDSINKQIYNNTNLPIYENEFNFDFCQNNDYLILIKNWIDYKKQINSPIKIQVQVQSFYKELLSLSNNNLERAKIIVNRSISNGYKSIYLTDAEQKEINDLKIQKRLPR
jgi:hypothetical protein